MTQQAGTGVPVPDVSLDQRSMLVQTSETHLQNGPCEIEPTSAFVKQLVRLYDGDVVAATELNTTGSITERIRPARYPSDPPAIARLFGLGDRLVSEIWVSSLDHARDAIDLVAPRGSIYVDHWHDILRRR
jgi:hypothetical protein